MNSYLFLFQIVFILTLVSFITESVYPVVQNENKNILKNFIYRFTHYFVFAYMSSFVFLFNYNSIDVYFYMFFVLAMFLSWYVAECCILTYYELCTYNLDHTQFETTFHPTMKSIFRDYDNTVMILIGIIMTITIAYILYYNTKISLYVKIIYAILYTYLLSDSFLKSRSGEKQYYPKDSDSFFVKHILQ